MGTDKEQSDGRHGLKREMGLMAAVNVILGVMIGSGIFISPQDALKYSGSIGACLAVWTACGLISLLGALCFAELGTIVPRSGAEWAYLLEAFSKTNSFFGPLPSFICAFIYVLVLRPAEIAVIVMAFAEYSIEPFGQILNLKTMDPYTKKIIIKLVSFLALGLITYINLVSVRLYVKINNIFGACKVFACLIVIAGGIYQLALGNTKNLSSGFEGTTSNFGFIALAFYNGLWAYDGWSSVTTITEEIKRPEVNIPRSIAIAVPIVTCLYVFMNLSYMIVLTPNEIIESPAVGMLWSERVLGPLSFLIPLGVALSTFGCALSIQFGVTRLCFVAGREGHMLEPLSYIHVTRSTPAVAVCLQGVLAFVFLVLGDIATLIEFASFLIWFFYGSAMVALLVMRKTHAKVHRPYKVNIFLPIFTLVVSIFLVVTPIVSNPDVKYLSAIAFIMLGVAVYIPFVYLKKRPRIMNKITHLIQLSFLVAPSHDIKES